MVETNLTREMMESGAALVRSLDELGIEPDAAFWLYSLEQQIWKLVIAEIKLGEEGPKAIYRKIQEVLTTSPDTVGDLSLDDVVLVKPDAHIVTLLRMAVRTGPEIKGIRLKGSVISGTLIEDAFIYRVT